MKLDSLIREEISPPVQTKRSGKDLKSNSDPTFLKEFLFKRGTVGEQLNPFNSFELV